MEQLKSYLRAGRYKCQLLFQILKCKFLLSLALLLEDTAATAVTRSETSLYNTAVIPSLWKCKYMVQNNKNDCKKEEKQKLIYIILI